MTSDKKLEGGEEAKTHAGMGGHVPEPANDQAAGGAPAQETTPASSVEDMAKLQAEAADLKDRLLRAHAEMDNVRKRLEREKADQAKFAITKFARDIVGIGDNVQRAIEAVPQRMIEQDAALKSFFEGVTMIERELLSVLGRHGIKRLDPKGEPFDPHYHQAVVEVPSEDVPAGSVTQVFQSGYIIEDRVLRPAMVAVSKGGAKPQAPAEAVASGVPISADGNPAAPGGDAAAGRPQETPGEGGGPGGASR
ncbi:MAG: nucleotide exchange factor GrpE [Hyphomicrobiaceae bacterium]